MFFKSAVVAIAVIVAVKIPDFEARQIPSFIKPCKQNDPKLNQCIIQQVENIRPYFKKGVPEFELPPMDPLHLPSVIMDHGNGAAVSFKAKFNDLIITGSQNVVIKKIDVDMANLKIRVHVFFPKLRIESDYKITGNVLVLPISGSGHSDGNFTEIDAKIVLTGKYEMRDGKRFIKIMDKKVSLVIGDSKLYFSDLFNGNKELSESTNQLINENSKDIVQEITPLVEDTIAALVFKMTSRVFDIFSVDELLPPN